MRNLTWLAYWFRRTNRSLPRGTAWLPLALAMGMNLGAMKPTNAADQTSPQQSRDNNSPQAPAPVLRVARDQPQLNAPKSPVESITPTKTLEPIKKFEPTKILEPNKTVVAASDQAGGWVAKGMIGKQVPLSDPTPKIDPKPQVTLVPVESPAPVVANPLTKLPLTKLPATKVLIDEEVIESKKPNKALPPIREGGWYPVPRIKDKVNAPVLEIVPEEIEADIVAPELNELDEDESSETLDIQLDEPDNAAEFDAASDSQRFEETRGEETRDIPVRRPHIESSAGRAGNSRSRELQDEIERFEEEDAADAPAIDDQYDSPEAEAELMKVVPKEVNPLAERLQQQGRQPAIAPPAPVLSAAALRLQKPIQQILQYHYQRPEKARERTPWGMLHAILPYGVDAQIDTGRKRFNAIAWLAGNNPARNLKILSTTKSGRVVANLGVGLQGHQAQLLAIFAQNGVPMDYPLIVGNRRFKVADLVQSEMLACKAGEELTFTLIGLSHYLPTDTKWRSEDGQQWDFERLVREELSQPVVGAACGGTHRLMGLSFALRQRRMEGLPITGQWVRADIFINDFVQYVWQLQNRDGSFSTDWFEGKADNGATDRKLQTSGHIMEWLVFNSTEQQLQDERIVRGITFLTNTLGSGRGSSWEVGPKGHALRALSLYHRRAFGSDRPWLSQTAPPATARTQNVRRR